MGSGGQQLQRPNLERLGAVDQPPKGRANPATQRAGHAEGDGPDLGLPEAVGHGPGRLFRRKGGGTAGAA